MKVLFITDPSTVGGATRSLVDVTSKLKENKVDCTVCTGISNDLNEELSLLGIENYALGHKAAMVVLPKAQWKKPLKYILDYIAYRISTCLAINKINKLIDLNSVDIIHTNSARNDIGCYISKKYNIPHIIHLREFGQEDFDCVLLKHNYYDFLTRYSKRFIAISNAVRSSWIQKGIDERKIDVIYNGVAYEDISVSSQNEMKDSLELHCIIAGGICEAKGQMECVEAIHLLPDSIRRNVFLDIVGWGDSEYITSIKGKIYEYQLEDRVHFLGVQQSIHPFLRNYQIGLMCSRSEGFGRVTAEYMFAGLGIIASNAGANPEIIHDGVNGLLYNLASVEDLSKKIQKFYLDRDFMVKCGVQAMADAKSKYTIEKNVSGIIECYNKIMEQYNLHSKRENSIDAQK